MPSIHRVNAIIAYINDEVTYYTNAADGQQQIISKSDNPDLIRSQLFSWPSFRAFMDSIGFQLPSMADISSIRDIAWSVDMEDETGRRIISGFEAKGGSGTNSNDVYDPIIYSTVDAALNLGPFSPSSVTVANRGVSYSSGGGSIVLVGGTFSEVATFAIASFSTITGQTETNYTGGELTGVITPGTGHATNDIIIMSDGTVVRVDDHAAGAVDEFTILSASTSGFNNWATITQTSTTGGGSGFALTMDDDNQSVFSVTSNGDGSYTELPSNPVSTTGGNGTGVTLNVQWA